MSDEPRRARLTKLLALLLIFAVCFAQTQGDRQQQGVQDARIQRAQRDLDGVATVLLVSAKPGKSSPPLGILTKTARTFVQDGASTEYATQVLGTTLANGRLYARILSTSSRVFYEKQTPKPDPTPGSDPFVVYPSQTTRINDWQFGIALDNAVADEIIAANDEAAKLDEISERENDVFGGSGPTGPGRPDGFKPAKVRPTDNLPTYTVGPAETYESTVRVEGSRFAPKDRNNARPKLFGAQAKNEARKTNEMKITDTRLERRQRNGKTLSPLNTVTYHGFADFTTTVGDTVIVFSPSTAPAPMGRPATTIKGAATLRPEIGIAVKEIHATNVNAASPSTALNVDSEMGVHHDATEPATNGGIDDPLLEAINGRRQHPTSLEPSTTGVPETEAETRTETTPLLISETTTVQTSLPEKPTSPTGLLSTVVSTTSDHGTTTLYKSLIYGTYVGTDYARVTHTASDVYFFPDDEATVAFGADDDVGSNSSSEGTMTTEKVTMESNELTTTFDRETTDGLPATLNDDDDDDDDATSTFGGPKGGSTLPMPRDATEPTPAASPTTEKEIANDILQVGDHQGRSIKAGTKNQLPSDEKKGSGIRPVDRAPPAPSTALRVVPTTVYKTFTRMTTFYIPDENNPDVTSTSVKTGEVVSSEVSYLTEFAATTAMQHSSAETTMFTMEDTTNEPTTIGVTDSTMEDSAEEPKTEVEEEAEPEQTTKQDEEIELIFKTLYTTYTYLTTFFHETTSSVSSREVVETNVVTQTVGPYYDVSADVAGLFGKDRELGAIAPTMVSEHSSAMPTMMPVTPSMEEEDEEEEEDEDEKKGEEEVSKATQVTNDDTTTATTTLETEETDVPESMAIPTVPSLEPTPALSPSKEEEPRIVERTYYTTFTYFTSIFVEGETEVLTRTTVQSNVVTDTIAPSATISFVAEKSAVPTSDEEDTALDATTAEGPRDSSSESPTTLEVTDTPVATTTSGKSEAPPDILAYLAAIQGQKSAQEALEVARRVQQKLAGDELPVTEDTFAESTTMEPRDEPETSPPADEEVLETMVTDVVSTSSSGGGTLISGTTPAMNDDENDNRRNPAGSINAGGSNPREPEDQELSESNTSNHEIEPAPTLLLQTSYTTFTYFTTMYRGDASSVLSRLETVTNVVTETIRPSMEASDPSMSIEPTSTLPVTYFTTFTYWTTFYRGGDTLTTSREKTVSNVVYPGSDSGSVTMTTSELPGATEIFGNEVLGSTIPVIHIPAVVSPSLDEVPTVVTTSVPTVLPLPAIVETSDETPAKTPDISPSLSTVYTTLTYFTTSYVGDSTVLHSRLETITSVTSIDPMPSTTEPEVDRATARAIDGGAVQVIDTRDKPDLRPTGLISAIRTSVVNDGTTTHLATDIHGTFVDGLYARVLESSTSIEVPEAAPASTTSARPTPVLPTGILSLDHGSIVEADQITTVYFTTRQIGTVVDGLYAKIIESESRTSIDEARQASIAPTRTSGTPHRTGLVRVIEGRIEANDTTTFYRSRVIGTSIDGRYAQIIESTSSWAKATPTKTASVDHGIAATSTIDAGSLASSAIAKDEAAVSIHPSPAVVQSSMPEDASTTTEHPGTETSHRDEDDEEQDENEDGEGAGDGEDDDDEDDGQRSKKKTRLTFSTRKRTFTPVIRPFASRNRPTFNPKRKGVPQGATTITRTDITPTITATLASGKGNRFSNSRSRLNSPTGPYSSSLYQQQSSGSRRFSGRRSSATVTPSSGYPSGSTRGRASSRISPSSVYPGRRASTGSGPNSVGSGGRGGFASRTASPFSGGRPIGSSAYGGPAGSSRYRPGGGNGIRASSTLLRGQATVRNEDQDEDANDFSATTLVTEDTPTSLYTDADDIDGATTPIQTTTESARRSTNPLLRFRRPFGIGNGIQGRTIGTQRPSATTTTTTPAPPRRTGNLLARPNNPVGRRPNLPISPRPRTVQTNSLFPPRGLFNNNRRPETTEAIDAADPLDANEGEDEGSSENGDDDRFEDVDEEPIEEIADNDYEGSEREETASGSANRRSSNLSTVRIRPFAGFAARNVAGRRVRRQASQLRSLTSRFRRPGTSTASQQQAAQTEDKEEQRSETEDTNSSGQRAKSSSRYGTRGRSSTTSAAKAGSNKDEAASQSPSSSSSSAGRKQRTRTKPSTSSGTRSSSASSPRVRPSPTSSSGNSGRQFTLREKDSGSSSRTGYKRTSSGSSSRGSGSSNRPEVSSRPRPPRLRGSSSRPTHAEAPSSPSNSRRLPSNNRARTSTRTGSSGNRRVPSQRGSTREESQYTLPENDGTITVTHYVPTEVIIPVVSNGVTEHRNVITAQPSTEILGPDRYSTVIGGDGKPLVVIAGEVTGTNGLGQTEVTRFLLHESSTTSILYAPTNLGGRRTSYSRVVPSTVYSVENVVSTKQPALPAPNAPLANILLSQLLLGQLGQANPLLGGFPQQQQQPQQPVTPSTRYDTRTTSYVTTITKEQSTVIPLTFRGKEILTTLIDSTTNVITATEYITDTVVVTPTAALAAPGPNPVELNSLLLLLQQPQQPQPLLFSQPNAFDPLFASAIPSLTRSNTLAGEAERRQQPADLDYKPYKDSDSYEDGVAEASWSGSREDDDDDDAIYSAPRRPAEKRGGSRTKSRGYGNKPSYRPSEESTTPAPSPAQVEESSVITLYVSGRRPGEFSTVLSTVRVGEDATRVRRRRDLGDDYPEVNDLESSRVPFSGLDDEASIPMLAGSEEPVAAHAPTQSLESVVGDTHETEMTRGFAPTSSSASDENDVTAHEPDVGPNNSPMESEGPKRLRIRIPIVRNLARRPIDDSTHRRRFVVTRVRALGPRTRPNEDEDEGTNEAPTGGHRITITRRRKIQPTGTGNEEKTRPRITRKKLVKVRPIEQLPTPSTPTISIITTGFYGSDVSSSIDEDGSGYALQDYDDYTSDDEDAATIPTPLLEVGPETIENQPTETPSKIGETVTEVVPSSLREETLTPVILTDHFFLPSTHEDAEGEDEYEDEEEAEEAEEVENETTHATSIDDVQTTETSDQTKDSIENEQVLPVTMEAATISSSEPVQTENSQESSTESMMRQGKNASIAASIDDIDHMLESSTESIKNEEQGTTVPSRLLDDPKNISEPKDENNISVSSVLDDAKNIPDKLENVGKQTITASSVTPSTDLLGTNPLVSQDPESNESPLETTIQPNVSPTNQDTASQFPVALAKATVINDRPRTDSPVTFAVDLAPVPVPVRSDSEPSSDPVPSSSAIATNHTPLPSSTIASAPIYDDDVTTPTESFRYSETVVTSTRLRTYTYVVTKLNGLDTEVTSSTEVRPKVTTLTLTLTVPVAAAASTRSVSPSSDSSLPGSQLLPSPTQISTSMPLAENDGDDGAAKTVAVDDDDDEQGRRFNLATRIMSNGVGVIVAANAGSSSHIAPRWENPSPSIARPPTLTVSDALVMLMPRDTEPREFVTKTCTTTFAYLGTYVDNAGVTRVTTRQEIVYNTATEEIHGTGGSAASGITLEASPTLGTEVFETTYTYLDVSDAEGRDPETRNRSTVIVTNTVTAPQRYLDVILEPSETPRPETNAYPSTRTLERTFTDEAGRITIRPVNDVVTRLVVTESARAPRPVSSIEASSNDPVDADIGTTPDVHEENVDGDVISRTYFVTYSYYRTLVEDGSTVVHTNVATSSDVVTEKVPANRIGSTKPASIVTEAPPSHASPEPIQIFATKTYLTTYTYFTTLLQADTNGETSTTVSSRSRVVENVVTESIAPSLLEANDYASALLRTVARPTPTHVTESSAETNDGQKFEGLNNVVTGSTIIFFDEEDQIDSTATVESTTPLATETLSTTSTTKNREPAVVEEHAAETHSTTSPSTAAITQASASQEKDNATSVGGNVGGGSFGSLGPFSIHGLSALGPVITAMAGLLQGKPSATRRNDTVTSDVNSIFDNLTTHRHRDHNEPYEDDISATRRSPVYIPVAEFADASDIETAESQNIGNRLAASLNRNYIPESRHKVAAASLTNGIPISPGEVITANSDVIIGKPGKLGPRPPQRDYASDNDHVEMLPPPIASASFDASLYQHSLQRATVEQQQKHQQQDNDVDAAQIQIVPARQVFEEHLRFTSASKDRESSATSQSGAPRPAVFRPPAPRPAARPPSYVQQQQQQQQQISSGHSSSQSRLEMESNRRATAAALPDDPLLKPPGLTINALPARLHDQKSNHGSAEPSIVTVPDPKEPNWSPEKYRRPWSAKDPLETPDSPPVTTHGMPETTWVDRRHQKHEHPAPWAQKDPLLPEATIPIVDGGASSRPHAAVPGSPNGVRHVVPHVIDRPTGQPLLVNIQPSQVANVVIPQGGNQALIFGDTNEPHITGQYFDDPSPYPDPEVAAGFTIGGSLKKTEDPTEYMVPPLSSPPINYQQAAEVPAVGGVRPPDFPGRTEILVRPASSAPPPPRRSEVGGPPPRRYVVLGKRPPMPTNDVPGWKRKPEKKTTVPIHRPSMVNIRRQPPPNPTRPFSAPSSHEIHGGAAGYGPGPYGGRKPSYVISPSRGSNVAKTPDAILTPPYRTPFVSRVPTIIDGQMHVDQFHSRPEVSTSSQQQMFTGNVTPGYSHHVQSNGHYSNDQNRSDIPITESTLRITKQENVPTGAVEYHDPSTDPEVRPVDASYYPRLPTVRPEVQSFGQILPHPEDEDENRVRDKWNVATQTERTGLEHDSELGESQETIHRIKEVSVGHGLQFHTPVHDAANPNENDGPDEGPIIVRGKPFGVYAEDGQTNGDVTGQHSPTLEIDDILVQGVPFGYHGNDPIAPTRSGQEPKDSTSLIVYHPYPHQQHVPNRHEDGRPESQGFAEPTPTLIYAAQPTAPSSSGILVLNTPTQYIAGPNLTQIAPPSATSHGNGEPQADVYYDEVSTSELNLAGSTYHPSRGDIAINHNDDDEDDGIEFSLAVDATGEETNSDGQTERPPSMFSVPTTTTTTTSFDVPMQREPVSRTDRPVATNIRTKVGGVITNSTENNTAVKSTRPRPRPPVPHRDMMPPPLSPMIAGKREDVSETLGLEPPPLFPDLVVGLSPPPLAPVTPPNNSPASSPLPPPLPPHSSSSLLPPKYIPLADSTNHAASRPFLMEILSQDMVPPAITHETLRPMPELSTIRPTVAVSGSIQLATVETTTSQLPISPIVSKSRIPVIHGTTSAIVDVTQVQPSPSTSVFSPQFTRTKQLEGLDGYVTNGTVIAVPVDPRPATSRPTIRYATTTHPTKPLRPTYATTLRPHPVDRGEPNRSSTLSNDIRPSRPSAIPPMTTARTTEHLKVTDPSSTTSRPERVGSSVLLQPSKHNNVASHTTVPTEALSKDGTVAMGTIISEATGSMSMPTTTLNELPKPLATVTRADQHHGSVTSATLRPSFIESAVQDYATTQKMRDEETSEHRYDATQSVVRLSIAKKEKPDEDEDASMTRTHLLTHTLISTTIETVTETLPRITSSTKVTTAPPLTVSSTMRPHGTNDQNGDSIFVVMSDHQPPNMNAEEVEAEYGSDEDEDLDNDLGKRREGSETPENDDDDDDEEDRDDEATRDEQDPIGSNEIHRVLAGGILGAPAFPREPTVIGRCLPDCRASKAEVCTEMDGEMRCTCRPGFARMFPDRPCKPIYTYTIRIGLERIGRDSVVAIAPLLNESTSDEYKRLAESTRDALDRTMMQSDLRDVYRGLKIAGFQADTTSTGVDFHAQFSNNADEAKLEEVVRKYLVGNNYSLGGTEVYAAKDLDLVNARDFDECATTEGGPYHDCSPHAACFNLRGSYQCSCSEGWADLSDNLPAYPGRVCSQAPLGCTACNNKGHCAMNSNGQEVCECFPWHTGQRCQVNLKVLLIALVTTGIVLLGLLGACVGFACFGGSRRRGSRFAASRSGDRRAMIAGSNDGCGDTSSEGSAADLAAIPDHVPHVLPAPPKTAAPAPPTTKRHAAVTKRNESSDLVPVAGSGGAADEQRDRSLTVMIPRAKYRSVPQSPQLPTEVTRINEKAAESTNMVVDERKLLGYLEGGSRLADDRRANVANKRRESSSRAETNADGRQVGRSGPTSGSGGAPSGALVSAGFQVSATVMNRFADAESTLARSCGETTVEPSTRIARSDPIDFPLFTESCVDETTTITNISPACITRTPTTTTMTETTTTANQPATKLLRLQMSDLGDVGSTLARSCGETTIQPPTRMSSGSKMRRSSSREPRDNASDGHTMAERDVGGTLRMPAQRPPFYDPDSRSSDRESNFDSL